MERVIAEHSLIMAKRVQARDAVRADFAMRAHLDGLAADIPDICRLDPNYFAEAKSAFV